MMFETQQRKTKKTTRRLIIAALLMFGFAYLLIPFYTVICKVSGLNGKTSSMVYQGNEDVDYTRTIRMQLIAMNNDKLPWEFRPQVQELMIHPGEEIKTAFFAQNNTNTTMTIQAVPSVSPGVAAEHLKKIECFCFERQTLEAHASKEMPLRFVLSRELPSEIKTVSLSYTLFDVNAPLHSHSHSIR